MERENEIVELLEVIIKLIGRSVFTPTDVRNIVTLKKGKKSSNYIKGYNACDGTKTVTELAKIIGVTPATLSPILKYWEEIGIIYKRKGFYKKIFPI